MQVVAPAVPGARRERVVRNPWKPGPAAAAAGGGPVVVSATRFVYRGRRHLPLVALHAWQLRRAWGRRAGAVGLFTGAEVLRPVTYSLSVWRSEEDLRAFLRSPEHARLVRRFKGRLRASTSVIWEEPAFVPGRAWREGLRRLAISA